MVSPQTGLRNWQGEWMSEELRQVGARLRDVRRERGLTLDELASRSGMSMSTLSRLESGKRQASLELLLPLTRQLGIRIDHLVQPETPDPPVPRPGLHRARTQAGRGGKGGGS